MLNVARAFILPLAILLFFTIVTQGRFINTDSLFSILRTAVVPMLVAMSMSFGMLMGMWNFATGAIVFACAIFSAKIAMALGIGIPGMCVISILIGVGLSTAMGLLYNWLRIPCLVLSLGCAMIIEALPNIFINDATGKIGLLDGYLGGMPWCFIIAIVMFAILYFLNDFTTFGADVRAIGANISIANSAGIKLDRVKFLSFVISGLFLGVAGIIYISINISAIGVTGFASASMLFDGMMGIFVAMVLVKYINYNFAVLIGVITIRLLGAGLVACGLSSETRGILTGTFLFLVMAYSANAGVWDKYKQKKAVAAEANAAYKIEDKSIAKGE